MAELINPFIGFKTRRKSKYHNPYEFNPFTVLGIDKEVIAADEIIDLIKKMEFRLNPKRLDRNSLKKHDEDKQFRLDDIKTAQRFLQDPVQRLAFEILISDITEDKK